VGLSERAYFIVVAVFQDLGPQALSVATPALDRSTQAMLLGRPYCAIERHPAHQLGVHKMLGVGTHFPDAFVLAWPEPFEMLEQAPLQPPIGLVDVDASACGLIKRSEIGR